MFVGLRSIYYKFEDSWYGLIDKIDKRVPVYGLIDKIDKIIPSFVLFLLIFVLIIFLLLSFSLNLFLFGNNVPVTFSVVDSDNNPVSGAILSLEWGDNSFVEYTTDVSGKVIDVFLPLEEEVFVEINKTGFRKELISFIVEPELKSKVISLSSISSSAGTRTLYFKDGSSGSPIRNASLNLSFSCSSPSVVAPSNATASSESFLVNVPEGCGTLSVTVTSEDFETRTQTIPNEFNNVYLSSKSSQEFGSVLISLKYEGVLIAQDGIRIELFNGDPNAGEIAVKTGYSNKGQVRFDNVPLGNYFIKVSSSSNYSNFESEVFAINNGALVSINLELSKNVVGTIKFNIKDMTSKRGIDSAILTIKLNGEVVERRETDSNGFLEFFATSSSNYDAIITHKDYCYESRTGLKVGDVVNVSLKRNTGNCGAKLKVKVLDSEGVVVENAKVGIFDEDKVDAGYAYGLTDLNGNYSFNGVETGTYRIFAFKGNSFAWSDAKIFNQQVADETVYNVVLEIPNSTIRVRVLDQDRNPVQFAKVSFIDNFNNKIIGSGSRIVEDVNGFIELNTRSDKEVYVFVEADGFSSFTSLPIDLVGKNIVEFEANLIPSIISGDIEINFKGLYLNNFLVQTPSANSEYTALFEIRIPENKNYKNMLVHLRTGENKIMELDKIVIAGFRAAGISNSIRSSSFSPPKGYNEDLSNISSDEAKWINLEWVNPKSGVILVEAKVRIKETANDNDSLKLFWRVQAERSNGVIERNPLDETLGSSASAYSLNGLYANTDFELFYVGEETLCNDKFCFNFRIEDDDSFIRNITDVVEVDVGRNYIFYFDIMNNSEFETDYYPNTELKLFSEYDNLLFKNYTLITAENNFSSGVVMNSELDWVSVGNWNLKQNFSGSVSFRVEDILSDTLVLRTRSNNALVFEKSIIFSAVADNEFLVEYAIDSDFSSDVPLLASGTENSLMIKVRDKITSLEVDNAQVRVKDRFGNEVLSKITNSLGNVSLVIPASSPNNSFVIEVVKPNYKLFSQTINVNDKVLSFSTDKLGVSLNTKLQVSADVEYDIMNESGMDLVIDSFYVKGNQPGFDSFVNLSQMNNWLRRYEKNIIPANGSFRVELRAIISDLAKDLSYSETTEGIVVIEVSGLGGNWSYDLPLNVAIGLGGEVDDPTCLELTQNSWSDSTQGNPVFVTFDLVNNCAVDSIPVDLRNVSAKLIWNGNSIGKFSLRSDEGLKEIRGSFFRPILYQIPAYGKSTVTLQFEPDAGIQGIANAVVEFEASNPTDSTTQKVGDSIEVSINAVNLKDCVIVSEDLIEIEQNESGSFSVQTLECGQSTQVFIESPLSTSPNNFSLEPNSSEEIEIVLQEEIAGQYPIYIYVRGEKDSSRQLIDMIRVRVPTIDGCWELSKYEYDIYDSLSNPFDGVDTGILRNNCYDSIQSATIDERDWMEALKDGAKYGAIGFLLGWFGSGDLKSVCPFGLCDNLGKDKEKKDLDNSNTDVPTTNADTSNTGVTNDSGSDRIFDATPINNPSASSTNSSTSTTPDSATNTTASTADKVILGSSSLTGFSLLGSEGIGSSNAGSNIGSAAINALGGVLGKANPWTWGLLSLGIGTLVEYNNQGDKVVSYLEPYLNFKEMNLYLENGTSNSSNIIVNDVNKISYGVIDKTLAQNVPLQTNLGIIDNDAKNLSFEHSEKRELEFVNRGAEQTDPFTPFYRILEVQGTEYSYKLDYDKDVPSRLEVKKQTPNLEQFHLQFNAYSPTEDVTTGELANCFIGGRAGSTGENALPRIKFDWSWDGISEVACDETNNDYIYCDGTQFLISTMKKLYFLKNFVEDSSPFNCPSASGVGGTASNLLSNNSLDVAVTKLQVIEVSGDNNVLFTIESNNGPELSVSAEVKILNHQTQEEVYSCDKVVSVVSKSTASCFVDSLESGFFDVIVSIEPVLCEECENNSSVNDSIDTTISQGVEGLEQCEPYQTGNDQLKKYLEATERKGNAKFSVNDKEKAISFVKFNTNLIQEAYTDDLITDFIEYYSRNVADAPPWFEEEIIPFLERRPNNESVLNFVYPGSPNRALSAGKYGVEINIKFNNPDWQFFDNEGNIDVTIDVVLTPHGNPEPDSAFYYIPFDGEVGIDSADGRQGYGINYAQTSMEAVKLIDESNNVINTSHIVNSNPIQGGVVELKYIDDFGIINEIKRGSVLSLERSLDKTIINFSPSFATPVLLEVNRTQGLDAKVFYSIEIAGAPQVAVSSLLKWDGVGYSCKDFVDAPMSNYQNRPDIAGSEVGAPDGSYGFEWRNANNSGRVYLRTVAFTPQSVERGPVSSSLVLKLYQDDATLKTSSDAGTTVALNGNSSIPYNSLGSELNSIDKVFDLVKEEYVCVVGNEFFWNPKKVYDSLSSEFEKVNDLCIQ